jgi:hypothetical protein
MNLNLLVDILKLFNKECMKKIILRTTHFLIVIFWSNIFAHAASQQFYVTGEIPCHDDICMTVIGSQDGRNWIPVSLGIGARDVVKGDDKYLAAGWCAPVWSNSDGISWEKVQINRDCWNNLSYTNHKYFISGGIGDASELPKLSNVVYGNNRYIAVGFGDDGNLVSSDGMQWDRLPSYDIGALTFDGRQFVAMNRKGVVGRSQDGSQWVSEQVDAKVNSVIWVSPHHQFVAVGDDGKVLTSQDAINWTMQTSGVSSDLNKLTYTFNLYIAVGKNGTIITSPDAITWTEQDSHTNYNLVGVA